MPSSCALPFGPVRPPSNGYVHTEYPEVANVPRRHRHLMHFRRGRDHGVLAVGFAMLETRSLPGGASRQAAGAQGGDPSETAAAIDEGSIRIMYGRSVTN